MGNKQLIIYGAIASLAMVGFVTFNSYMLGKLHGYDEGYKAAEAKFNKPAITTTEPARTQEGNLPIILDTTKDGR